MSARVLLLAAPGEARDRYEERLRALGADYAAVDSLRELSESLLARPWSGLLLDVPTMIRAEAEEKRRVQGLLDFFPVLRLRWDPEAEELRCLFYGMHTPGHSVSPNPHVGECGSAGSACGSLEEFLRREAGLFPARGVRATERSPLHLSVTVHGAAAVARAASLNLSRKGLFAAMAEGFAENEPVRVEFIGFSDLNVQGVVRRVVPWGPAQGMPGIGVEFCGELPEPLAALLGSL